MVTVPVESVPEKAPAARTEADNLVLSREIEAAKATAEREIARIQARVRRRIDDTGEAAKRMVRRSRYAVTDSVEEISHQIRKHPVGSLAIAFAAGAALSFLLPRPGKK